MTTSRMRGTQVASVSRAMRVLEAFAGHPTGVALGRLSRELGYGKPSLSKILGTLERDAFVRRDGAGHFHLSWRLLALAFAHAQRVGLSGISAPILQALADETDELVQLAVVEGEHVLFVAKAEGPGQRVRMVPLVGVTPPPHATASGKVWLASLPESDALAIVRRQGFARVTPRTITSEARLRTELRRVRREGYAIADEELEPGLVAVAAPVRRFDGRIVAAVNVSGPSFRFRPRLPEAGTRVARAADELGRVAIQATRVATLGG